ncbi:peroxide stress protein YaaA [Alkalibacter rhizosphaerae]|uniref:Peroxide stress protein YaaA n=1 Tax=Alkalibacter rhizosphaerae TaxID=2815577 RepID=A0A974XE80_9FIRM|nr:peroxide stress protein YaaA [Alkalibacter rhizosphaerae]QSX08234.1 peroxide stress protein YaaA [Alkalibacter rhizosphaerae]
MTGSFTWICTGVILNLASKEYSKAIKNHLAENTRFITCVFGERIQDKIVEKGTLAKMARGEMFRFMAENQIRQMEEIRSFNCLGYEFSKTESNDITLVFVKRNLDQ